MHERCQNLTMASVVKQLLGVLAESKYRFQWKPYQFFPLKVPKFSASNKIKA